MRNTLGLPWKIKPLEGKYYGTRILDCYGNEAIRIWDHDRSGSESDHLPSVRQWEQLFGGGDFSVEIWRSYVSDSHFESRADYEFALALLESVNGDLAPQARDAVGNHL